MECTKHLIQREFGLRSWHLRGTFYPQPLEQLLLQQLTSESTCQHELCCNGTVFTIFGTRTVLSSTCTNYQSWRTECPPDPLVVKHRWPGNPRQMILHGAFIEKLVING